MAKGDKGEFINLRTVGRFLIFAKLQDSKIKQVEIQSTAGGDLRLLTEWDNFRVVNEGGKEIKYTMKKGLIYFSTQKGENYKVIL